MKRKTQSYYGNPDFQSRMLMIFAGVSFLQGAFMFVASYSVINLIEKTALKSGLQSDHLFFELLNRDRTFLFLIVTSAVLISAVASILIGMRFTHEAIGAIYRMKKEFKTMVESKKIDFLNLRKNDYFKDVEVMYNDMIEELKLNKDK